MKTIFSNKYVRSGLLILGGLFLGWLFFHSNNKTTDKQKSAVETKKQMWTCSMHPQIRVDHP
ncbi:MAG TPA: efflux RND transporter periplasmic adaptor subunit, partial [Paludibacter sp.]